MLWNIVISLLALISIGAILSGAARFMRITAGQLAAVFVMLFLLVLVACGNPLDVPNKRNCDALGGVYSHGECYNKAQ